MSLQYNPYHLEHLGRKRQQELMREADQVRLGQTLATPRTKFIQQMMNKFSNQITDGMRALTRQPRRMQGAT